VTVPAKNPVNDEATRLQNRLEYEQQFWSRGVSGVAGVDEAGRGPLAGPVVAAAVVLSPGTFIEGVRDSKKLSTKQRDKLDLEIRAQALAFGIGASSARQIDRINIIRATTVAMDRALCQLRRRLTGPVNHVVIDGLPVKGLAWTHEAVVGGDDLVHSIACASVLAKVCRDRVMHRLASRYPDYLCFRKGGYGRAEHRAALDRVGPSPHHRMSFGLAQLNLFS
jgi:ribonuclease HII